MGHEARESCGFDHGGSFLKEKTWRRGTDGANDVWAKFWACYASFVVEASLLPTVKARNKLTLLISRGWRNETGAEMRSPLPRRDGMRFLLSMNQIFCAPAKLSARHSSLCFGQCEHHPTSLFWCCFVAMVTMCYCMRHGAVCTAKTISSLEPEASSQITNSSNFVRNNSLLHICTFSEKGERFCFLPTNWTPLTVAGAQRNMAGYLQWKAVAWRTKKLFKHTMYFIEGKKPLLERKTKPWNSTAATCSNILYSASVHRKHSNLDYGYSYNNLSVLYNTFAPLQSQGSKTRSLQFVTWCSASNCAAELPKLSPPFTQFMCSLCILKLWEKFQDASKELNEMRTKKKTSKNIHAVWHLEVLWAGSVSRKKAVSPIASSLGVKWRQNKKKAEPAWDWGYMGAAGEMLQSECTKSVSYVKTAHTPRCAHWQQQITFHMNTDWDFLFF